MATLRQSGLKRLLDCRALDVQAHFDGEINNQSKSDYQTYADDQIRPSTSWTSIETFAVSASSRNNGPAVIGRKAGRLEFNRR